MRSLIFLSALLVLSLLMLLLPVVVFADEENHSPTMIIPTKFRFLLIDMIESQEETVVPSAPPVPVSQNPEPASQIPAGSTSPVKMDNTQRDEDVLAAGLAADSSHHGYGRGYVETNFDVNFESPGTRIDNRERLTARGLFDVHVSHGFN